MNPTLSEARLQANKANAQLSTGPRTPEGKAISAANSRTHGLCSKDLVIAPEEQPEFDALQADHFRELKPDNVIEQTLFEQVVAASWNLRRIRRIEAALQDGLDPLAAIKDETLQKQLDRLARHQTRLERSYHRAVKELKALQTERHNRSIMTPAYSTYISPLVDSIQISKRTQDRQIEFRKRTNTTCVPAYFPETRRQTTVQNEPKLVTDRGRTEPREL
jgi:hypothetical protein